MGGLRLRFRASALATIVLASAGGECAALPCLPEGGETAIIAAVGTDFSLTLSDGRTLRLAGIDPIRTTPDQPDASADAHASLASWLIGRSATVRLLSPAADRWGRLPALVFAARPAGGDVASVATRMVAEGFARGRPEPEAASCWPSVLASEIAARDSVLGLWRDPYYAVRRADDGRSLSEAAGMMVIAEGRVAHVGQTRKRLYVDLGPGRDSLALRLDRRDLFILSQLGAGQNDWVGHRIRVRGTLDDRHGPQIDLTDGDQVEVLDGTPLR